MPSKLWWDLETFSEKSIKDGSYAYAEKAEILLFAWAVDNNPVEVWDLTVDASIPPSLEFAMRECDEFWGWNTGNFDRPVMRFARPDLFEKMAVEKHRDAMIQAYAHGLPGSLDAVCQIYKLDEGTAKDKRGKSLIKMFCSPQPKNSKLNRKTRETHLKEWEEFKEYAARDITSMRALCKKMPTWNYPDHPFELRLWQLDREINDRGIYMDTELAARAIGATEQVKAQLAGEISEATQGEVGSANQRDKLLGFILKQYDVYLPDLRTSTLERIVQDPDLPPEVKQLIHIRLIASTASVNKYKRVLKSASSDGYLRGTIQFCGAGRTGRDAGRLFQPQNMMRPTLEQTEIDTGIEALKMGCADLITDNVMELCANATRGIIIAPPKQKIVVADLSNIEGRVLPWLAGEEWKLQAFRDYDAGKGPDLYLASYARTFGVPIEKAVRQIGKVLELAMGFGGGVGSFLTFATAFGLDLKKMVSGLVLPKDLLEDSIRYYAWRMEKNQGDYDLGKEIFVALDTLKRMWRNAHPAIVAYWKACEDAFVACASAKPGLEIKVNKVTYRREDKWLRVVLPSGRSLCYPSPNKNKTFMGVNQYSRKWQRINTYGGKLVENQTQAGARDIFKSSYFGLEKAGYSIRLPVHDENLTYTPDEERFNSEELSKLMAVNPVWAQDLPLAAAGFEAYRYRK